MLMLQLAAGICLVLLQLWAAPLQVADLALAYLKAEVGSPKFLMDVRAGLGA